MKVTVVMEPEEANEGDFGCTVMVSKSDVLLLDQLMDVYLTASKGAGWHVENVGAYNGKAEFWGNT
jgi:hypothetical protein